MPGAMLDSEVFRRPWHNSREYGLAKVTAVAINNSVPTLGHKTGNPARLGPSSLRRENGELLRKVVKKYGGSQAPSLLDFTKGR